MERVSVERMLFADTTAGKVLGFLQGTIVAILFVAIIFLSSHDKNTLFFSALLILAIVILGGGMMLFGPIFFYRTLIKKYFHISHAEFCRLVSKEILCLRKKIEDDRVKYTKEGIAQIEKMIQELEEFM